MISCTKDDENRVLELCVEGRITGQDFNNCIKPVEEMIERHGKIKVLEKIVSFSGIELTMLWEGLKFDMKHRKCYSHCAVVTDKKWMKQFSQLAGTMMGIDVKVFELDQLGEARHWLKEA